MPTGHPHRRHRLLIIDDDPMIGVVANNVFSPDAYETRLVGKAATGLRQIEDWVPDVVLLDHRLPDRTGVELLPQITAIDRDLPVLLITASRSPETTIEAVRRGAFDYLPKPLAPDLLRTRVLDALESRRLLRTPVVIRSEQEIDPTAESIIGECEEMQQVYKAIGRAVAQDGALLIQGETGTGKQMIARAIHTHSERDAKPMRCLQCDDYGAHELEGALFGTSDNPGAGLIAECAGGTILLREIAGIAPAIQSRLLGIIRQRSETNRATIRDDLPLLLFSTNQDVGTLVAERRVRSDLFYELCGNLICLPPLRRRGSDLRLLTEHFVRRLSQIRESFGQFPARVSDEAMRMFEAYHWPGNVTELKSVLRRSHTENRGTVLGGDFLRQTFASHDAPTATASSRKAPGDQDTRDPDPHFGTVSPCLVDSWPQYVAQHQRQKTPNLYANALELMERGLIAEVLLHTGGNLAASARMLGITRVSLRKKIHVLGIEVPGRTRDSADAQ